MRIGILKIGGRLTWDSIDKTGGIGEAKAICELMAYSPDNTVNIYTKMLKNERSNPINNIYIQDINEVDEIEDDVLIVFNGNVNFFGGQEDPEQIKNYILMNKFEGKVYYIFIDPELYLKQIYNSISKKEWGEKYNIDDIEITRDDIRVITSIYNKEEAYKKITKGKIPIQNNNIFYFPFEKYPLMKEGLPYTNDLWYDLMYMGTFRSGKREDKMIKFYFGHTKFTTTFIGKTKLKDFKKEYPEPVPIFEKPVKFEEINQHINRSVAHVCIGDKFYEGNILTPRIYESILNSTVCLIDIDMDPEKRVFADSEALKKFNYVEDKEDVGKKVDRLKNNPEFRKKIIEHQQRTIDFTVDKYHKQFMELIV
ncbi:MAG: hypothetical protein ACOCQD_02165 [archaeon]